MYEVRREFPIGSKIFPVVLFRTKKMKLARLAAERAAKEKVILNNHKAFISLYQDNVWINGWDNEEKEETNDMSIMTKEKVYHLSVEVSGDVNMVRRYQHQHAAPEREVTAAEFFHKIMGQIDTDWPYAGRGLYGSKNRICTVCKGRVYEFPVIQNAGFIVALGKQLGLEVKVHNLRAQSTCMAIVEANKSLTETAPAMESEFYYY